MADRPRLRHRAEAVIAARVIWLVPRWRRLLLARHAREQQALRPVPAWKSQCRFCRACIEQGLAGWVTPAAPDVHAPCPVSPDGAHYEPGEEIPRA